MLLKKGTRSEDVRRLQGGLAFLGLWPGAVDGDFGRSTEDAVEAFQRSRKLYADGIAGKMTLRVFNEALVATGKPTLDYITFLIDLEDEAPEATESAPTPAPVPSRLKWVRCDADQVPGREGYASTTLREDTAESFKKLREAANILGGVVTSAGGRRMLDTNAGANQSRMSLHYLGRAHDMSLDTGMVDPDTDSFIITRPDPASRYWRVFCRASGVNMKLAAAGFGIEGGEFTVDAWYVGTSKDARGRPIRQPMTKSVTFTGFDFTALASLHGWKPIPARAAFFNRGDRVAAEWWHFSHVAGLTNGTSFGSELLRVYTPEQAAKFVYWASVKDAKYGTDWS